MARPLPQLISALRADASVLAALGLPRVYADHPPQDDQLPFVVLAIESTNAWPTLNGCQVRAYAARVQVDILCDSRGKSEDVQEAVEDLLDGFTSNDANYPIKGVVLDSGIEWNVVNPIDGSDERGYQATQDFVVNYQRK